MGCLKLTYDQTFPLLKVAHSDFSAKEKKMNRFFISEEKSSAGKYSYSFNGMEKDDEVKGSGNHLDFGARCYDSRLGRFMSIDRFDNKAPSRTPYSYGGNSPIYSIDINGDSLYVLFYVIQYYGHEGYDDKMFKQGALTRKSVIESSSHFDSSKDKVVLVALNDLGLVKNVMAQVVEFHSVKYGKTKEVGFFSHSAWEGPIGSLPTSGAYPLRAENGARLPQMTLEGWNDIDFNWGDSKGENCVFYGCNSSNNDYGSEHNFSLLISILSQFNDITIKGQQKSSYPSISTTERKYTSEMEKGLFKGEDIYMVGSDGGADDVFFDNAYPMNVSKNGVEQKPQYQKEKTKF